MRTYEGVFSILASDTAPMRLHVQIGPPTVCGILTGQHLLIAAFDAGTPVPLTVEVSERLLAYLKTQAPWMLMGSSQVPLK